MSMTSLSDKLCPRINVPCLVGWNGRGSESTASSMVCRQVHVRLIAHVVSVLLMARQLA